MTGRGTITRRRRGVKRLPNSKPVLPLLELARVLVRFDHVASIVENADHWLLPMRYDQTQFGA